MKLILSALLLAVVPAIFAQNQTASPQPSIGVAGMEGQISDLVAHPASLRSACPLILTAANVAAPAGYLPVAQRRPDDGTLTLQFFNASGKAIQSASITATVKVKTNIYALDAHPISLQLTFSGTGDVDRSLNQLTQIALPRHYYLFGLATVSLDRVTYDDGTSWAAPRNNFCGVNANGNLRIAK